MRDPDHGKELAAKVAEIREILDRRYDEVVNGEVQLIDVETA